MTVIQGQQQGSEGSGNKEFSRRSFVKAGGVSLMSGVLLGLLRGDAKAQGLIKERQGVLPYFKITGVPSSVNATDSRLKHANEVVPAAGDVVHRNEIGFGTEHFLAEPGVRTLNIAGVKDGKFDATQFNRDLEDMRNSAAYIISPDTQVNFVQPGPSYFGPEEGGFSMYTAKSMELSFGPNDKPISMQLGAEENHSWMAIVKGLNRDYTTPEDLNTQLKIDKYEPGFTLGTRLPPGQFISEGYIKQNVAAAQGITCGKDGCLRVSVVIVDTTTGGYTLIIKDSPTAQWKQVKTNIK